MADNLACVASPDWQSPARQDFMAFIQSGKATMEHQGYETVDSR